MPVCSRCTHEITKSDRFCPSCGAAVAGPTEMLEEPTRGISMRAGAEAPGAPEATYLSSEHGRFEPGTRLGTRYRIVALLGKGGMGEVYRADDLELGQSVALKFLPEAVSANAAELARFRNEVRVARQIAHPNVCRVYDIGEADGHVFLSMEYIDGEDLASVLRRMGRPSADKSIEIARQICLGLAAAHEAGMLHRDLKPANVMIDGRGRARITDFGLAGFADELARDGSIAGTPAYMAPEQLSEGQVSARSDIYALGLVLYEVFTGKRVFVAKSLADLRVLHASDSITTPSELVRDLDPAVERVILQCLKKDQDSRPSSAYAVLAALPGGDPLAAALAAGETPSPELVANAGERGGLRPAIALSCVAAGLLAIGLWCGLNGPAFREFREQTSVLSVRAADILEKSGSFERLPGHTAQGFDLNAIHMRHLRNDTAEVSRGGSPAFYWRRWSSRPLESSSLHAEVVAVGDPPPLSSGQASVLLDPGGKLLGFYAFPPDSLPAAGARPDWSSLFQAAGLDSTQFTRVALSRPAPATCDTTVAWKGRMPGENGDTVTVLMGASKGRLTHFSIAHDWGRTTAPIEPEPERPFRGGDWVSLFFNGVLTLAASVYFGARNLRLGRGDRRGATRIALFVFAVNMMEAVFNTPLSEVGAGAALQDFVWGNAMGHSLIHAVTMWFAYMALEPYVRRLWPRILVSWARFVSGRIRDPLVGRDLLIGAVVGTAVPAISAALTAAAVGLRLTRFPTRLTSDTLTSLTGLSQTGYYLVYSGSVCVLTVLEMLVLLLVLRLAFRRAWPAVLVAALVLGFTSTSGIATYQGWTLAAILAMVNVSAGLFVLLRFGLLPALTATFVGLVMTSTVATLDFSSWYAGRALFPIIILLAILVYGAVTALAGKAIFGDPLREGPQRGTGL
jgi:hypothetical protein